MRFYYLIHHHSICSIGHCAWSAKNEIMPNGEMGEVGSIFRHFYFLLLLTTFFHFYPLVSTCHIYSARASPHWSRFVWALVSRLNSVEFSHFHTPPELKPLVPLVLYSVGSNHDLIFISRNPTYNRGVCDTFWHPEYENRSQNRSKKIDVGLFKVKRKFDFTLMGARPTCILPETYKDRAIFGDAVIGESKVLPGSFA